MGILGTIGVTLIGGIAWPITINWTLVISIFAVCFTAMATLIGIFGRRVRKEDVVRLENSDKNHVTRIETLKDAIAKVETEIATLTAQTKNNEKTIDEMKQDYRDIVQRLDDLLKQLMEFLNN